MYAELNSTLNVAWTEGHLPRGKLVVVKDRVESDGSFLLHHFLFGYLKSDQRACLVAFEQSLFHYTGVARKLVRSSSSSYERERLTLRLFTSTQAFNLQTAQSRGDFSFINALSSPYSWTQQQQTPTTPTPSPPQPQTQHSFSLSLESEAPLKELYSTIRATLCSTTTSKEDDGDGKESVLVIDSISTLANVLPHIHVLDFIHYLHLLVQEKVFSCFTVMLC